ncbi:hypothetical protein chiPu_0025125 [Chiloscyllium punctatum]|uniref:Laminin N-terminal domain-containing protein n=1 Tax=Chiloscyllium punctatum TaxID=137246 RepID=A0A401TEM9_CHIPU|nr:hypothetical protein [Chiloscyllium punctatum]
MWSPGGGCRRSLNLHFSPKKGSSGWSWVWGWGASVASGREREAEAAVGGGGRVPCIAMAPVLVVLLLSLCGAQAAMDSCYEPATGRAQRCMPEFCNAAFGRTVLASHVCGSPGPEEFCLQTGVTGVTKSCHLCDAHDSHNASLLNDFHSEEEPTWWQSPSMLHGIQFPNSVNLTLHLGE